MATGQCERNENGDEEAKSATILMMRMWSRRPFFSFQSHDSVAGQRPPASGALHSGFVYVAPRLFRLARPVAENAPTK